MHDVQGLYWMSRRDDENGCMVLFGGRIASGVVLESTEPLSTHRVTLFETLEAIGALGI